MCVRERARMYALVPLLRCSVAASLYLFERDREKKEEGSNATSNGGPDGRCSWAKSLILLGKGGK
jgi:hypothetical protein